MNLHASVTWSLFVSVANLRYSAKNERSQRYCKKTTTKQKHKTNKMQNIINNNNNNIINIVTDNNYNINMVTMAT